MGSNTHTSKIQTIATHWDQWNLLRDHDFDRYADMLVPTPKVYSAMKTLEKVKVPEITEWISLFCRTCFVKETGKNKLKVINDIDKSIVKIKKNALGIIMESTLMDGKDKHSLARKEARHVMTVCNYFHTISFIKRVCISVFHHHQKIRNWLNYWMRMIHECMCIYDCDAITHTRLKMSKRPPQRPGDYRCPTRRVCEMSSLMMWSRVCQDLMC